MKRKILFISSWYPTEQNKTTGIFVKRTAEAVSLHNEVAVIHVHGHSSFEDEVKIKVEKTEGVYGVYVLYKKKRTNPVSKYINYRKYYLTGLDYLLQHWGKPELVQLNVLYPAGIAALAILKKLNVPLITCEHWTGYHPEDGSYRGVARKYFTGLAVKKSAAIVTVSNHLKNAMINHGLSGNYKIIPNVVNTDVFKNEPRLNNDKFRFLHVSSLDKRQKNVEGLINAFIALSKKIKNIELVIIGDGENRNALEKQCGNLLNSMIFFEGTRFNESLAIEFNKANCFVLFSNYENLPVVVLESVCCGTPVIVSDVGGTREYVSEQSGYLVKAKDETDLLQKMEKMILENKSFDRKKISSYGNSAFSRTKVAGLFEDVYNEVLNTGKSAG